MGFTKRYKLVGIAALATLFVTPAMARPLSIRPNMISSTTSLSGSQKMTIQRALALVSERMFSERILTCAEEHSVRAAPDSQVRRSIAQVLTANTINLTINDLDKPCAHGSTNMPGWALRGTARVSATSFGESVAYLRIKLNYKCINYVYDSPDEWAGIIAHEMGHQLGLTHKNMPSRGTYVYEWGNCVEFNGDTDGLP